MKTPDDRPRLNRPSADQQRAEALARRLAGHKVPPAVPQDRRLVDDVGTAADAPQKRTKR